MRPVLHTCVDIVMYKICKCSAIVTVYCLIVQLDSEESQMEWRKCLGRAHASLDEQRAALIAYYGKYDAAKTPADIDSILDKRRSVLYRVAGTSHFA